MDIRLVEEKYGFRVIQEERIRNLYKLKTDAGIKCVKRAHMSLSFFCFIDSAIRYLEESGFDHVVPYLKTSDGACCVEDGDYLYYATDWVESRECRFKDEKDLKQAIRIAAELHRHSSGYREPEGAKPRKFYGRWIEKFEKKCADLQMFREMIKENPCKSEFDQIYIKDLEFYLDQGRLSIDALDSSNYRELSELAETKGEFCHHDMANHNFIVTPLKKMYLIDFDYCIMDTRLHDVSSLIIRNMRYGIWDLARAYFILDEYNSNYPLSDAELEVIKAFMIFPQDFWQVGLQYYVEHQPWTAEYFLARLNRIVDDKTKRSVFLQAFK